MILKRYTQRTGTEKHDRKIHDKATESDCLTCTRKTKKSLSHEECNASKGNIYKLLVYKIQASQDPRVISQEETGAGNSNCNKKEGIMQQQDANINNIYTQEYAPINDK